MHSGSHVVKNFGKSAAATSNAVRLLVLRQLFILLTLDELTTISPTFPRRIPAVRVLVALFGLFNSRQPNSDVMAMDCRRFILRGCWIGALALICSSGCIYFRGPKPPAKSDAVASAAKDSSATTANVAGSAQATPAELAAIMAEVQQLGAMDPAAQNALLEDLKKTDPSLWPQLMQTFRASIAYRKQSEERARLAAQQAGGIKQVAYANGAPKPLPEAADAALAPKEAPADLAPTYPDTHLPEVHMASAEISSDDWHGQLDAAIKVLENRVGGGGGNGSLSPAEQATLRMLYLAAGRRDDALKPLTGTAPAEQEFWSEELFGLATALDEQRLPDAQHRAAEAAEHLRDAASKLGQSATLVTRNLAFCSEVQSYGIFKAFPKYEFKPGQEVVLYAEVQNFDSETTDKGYHTALKSSYQIVDGRGARVAEQEYATTEEWCKNPRCDYFVRYFMYMPTRIYDGNYTLQLTIEDTIGNKVAQSSIPFTIVGAD
jgi:hypothetical protein